MISPHMPPLAQLKRLLSDTKNIDNRALNFAGAQPLRAILARLPCPVHLVDPFTRSTGTTPSSWRCGAAASLRPNEQGEDDPISDRRTCQTVASAAFVGFPLLLSRKVE
jgi:hypothetical protein